MKLISAKRLGINLLVVSLFLAGVFSVFGAGAVDSAFDPQLTKDFSANSTGSVALQPDGKIIVYGSYQNNFNSTSTSYSKRLNPDGSLDTSFNCTVCLSFFIGTVVVQPDGKILVSGSVSGFFGPSSVLIRLNADGTQDSSFATPVFPATIPIVVLQPDGRILVVYSASSSGFTQYSVRRLNTDGSLDNSFTAIFFSGSSSGFQLVSDLLLLPDGKILMGGGYASINSNGWIRRYNSDGSLDNTFEQPVVSGSVGSSVVGLSLMLDGSYLVTGKFTSINGVNRNNAAKVLPAGNVDTNFTLNTGTTDYLGLSRVLPDGKFVIFVQYTMGLGSAIARFNQDGSLDNSFTQAANVLVVRGWQLDPTGRIVFFGNISGTYRFGRLNADGSLDPAFSYIVRGNGSVLALAVQADGKILVSGGFEKANDADRLNIARINTNGTTDPTFNPGSGFNVPPTVLAVQTDGKILAAGNFTTFNGTPRTKIVRLNADGSLDAAFNPTVGANVYAIVPLASGKILIGGDFATVNSVSRVGIALLNADGSLDTSFNPLFAGGAVIRAIFVQTDGRIMVGGGFSGVNGFNRTNLVRLNADGNLDSSFNAGSIQAVYQIIAEPGGKYLVLHSATVARRNTDGTADGSFQSPTINGTLKTMLRDASGNIVIGGSFVGVNDITRNNLARLTASGSLDTTFFPVGANRTVHAIAGQTDGNILLGGDFSLIENVARTGIARLLIAPTLLPSRTLFDYDGDDKADISVFRPSENKWYILRSSNSSVQQIVFAVAGDIPVPADFDGDTKTDVAIFRPSTGDWWYLSSINGAQVNVHWGQAGDIPRPSDFDGDGKTDFVLYRPSNSVWYRLGSTGATSITAFGIAEDKPLVGDFDGDGKSDLAVFRPSTGDWWYASTVLGGQFAVVHWGQSGDIPVPGDYDADGKTDFVVYRPSNGGWYILRSGEQNYTILQFGTAEDKPVAADYDGDGKADVAVWRPSTGTWYLLQTTSGFGAVQWGTSGDVPTENAFLP